MCMSLQISSDTLLAAERIFVPHHESPAQKRFITLDALEAGFGRVPIQIVPTYARVTRFDDFLAEITLLSQTKIL